MYYVEKDGVYSHGVFGIFENLDDAIERAKLAHTCDSDDYHSWLVCESDPDSDLDYTKNSSDKVVFGIGGGYGERQ